MWLTVGEIRRLIDRFANDKVACERSLYPHFFSAKEEEGIYARMTTPKSMVSSGLSKRSLIDRASSLGRRTRSTIG
jgi:hypothetical protein